MKQIMEPLLEIQTLSLANRALKPEEQARVEELRGQVPAPILAHFDRLIVRGKKGIAIARNGACGECHLRLPSGTIAALVAANDVLLCENCDRYLYLPPQPAPVVAAIPAPAAAAAAPKTPGKRGRKKAAAPTV